VELRADLVDQHEELSSRRRERRGCRCHAGSITSSPLLAEAAHPLFLGGVR
jgi:hypothetical protein